MQRFAGAQTNRVSRDAWRDLTKGHTRLAARFLQIGKDISERKHQAAATLVGFTRAGMSA